jgi:endonuclease/exonuclease/phosphatase family metal-dependent hydrolase
MYKGDLYIHMTYEENNLMKKSHFLILTLAILILFIIQSTGTLVESIYILDLMTSGLDAKALGVLFFFVPLIFLPFYKRNPRLMIWVLFGLLLISRGIVPYLSTTNRLLASGIATGASFSLFFLLITSRLVMSRSSSIGLALAVALSAMLRTLGHGIEPSLTPAGGWIGWVLGVALGGCLYLTQAAPMPDARPRGGKRTIPLLGLYLVLTLVYFSISAPAVIARWTESNYTLIVTAVSLFSIGWAWMATNKPDWIDIVSPRLLLGWNVLFMISLTLTLLAQRVPFPTTLESAPLVVGAPNALQMIPLGFMLLLFPVLFLDFQVFIQNIQTPSPSAASLVPGILIGGFSLIILVFVNIFSNVWGYIKPISPPFRNTFWLAYFILSAAICLLIWRSVAVHPESEKENASSYSWVWSSLLTLVFLVTLLFALPTPHVSVDAATKTSLRLMTFNTQQSNDKLGEKSYVAQLALIQQVSPDLLALQETDSTRISLNNNDYVRYFADKLGYYSYFGPKTVAGTYGTAILSKFPLSNTQTIFMYSDKDETGVAEAEINVAGLTFTVYNVHPDSSDPAMIGFARTMIAISQGKPYVILMGDHNLRDYEEAYKLLDGVFTNAWTSVYHSEISPDGVDMSGENRIDHIFLSTNLTAVNPTYILPPASATDHAVHWTDIVWSNR